jgi:hypothetical protein
MVHERDLVNSDMNLANEACIIYCISSVNLTIISDEFIYLQYGDTPTKLKKTTIKSNSVKIPHTIKEPQTLPIKKAQEKESFDRPAQRIVNKQLTIST